MKGYNSARTAKKQKPIVRASKKKQPQPNYQAEYKKVAKAFLYGFRVIANWHMLVSVVHATVATGTDTITGQLALKYQRELIKVPEPEVLLRGTLNYLTTLQYYYGSFVDGYMNRKKLTVEDLQEIHAALMKEEKIYKETLSFHNCPQSTLRDLLNEITAQKLTAQQRKELQQKLANFSFDCLHDLPITAAQLDALERISPVLKRGKIISRKAFA
jgi:hypothetical protein